MLKCEAWNNEVSDVIADTKDTFQHSKLVFGYFFLINFTNEIFSLKALSIISLKEKR